MPLTFHKKAIQKTGIAQGAIYSCQKFSLNNKKTVIDYEYVPKR